MSKNQILADLVAEISEVATKFIATSPEGKTTKYRLDPPVFVAKGERVVVRFKGERAVRMTVHKDGGDKLFVTLTPCQ